MAIDGVVKNDGAKGATPSPKAKEKKPGPAEAVAAQPNRGADTARLTHEKNAEGPGKAHSGGAGTGGNVDIKV